MSKKVPAVKEPLTLKQELAYVKKRYREIEFAIRQDKAKCKWGYLRDLKRVDANWQDHLQILRDTITTLQLQIQNRKKK